MSAQAALIQFNCNVHEAVEYLLSHDGIVEDEWLKKVQPLTQPKQKHSLKGEDHEALTMVTSAVGVDEDEYLDIDLNAELEYITVYLAKISSVIQT